MSAEPLNSELSEWADGAEEGLVIFCLGHTINLRLDLGAFSSLMAAFSRLRQRVVFKVALGRHPKMWDRNHFRIN